MGNHNATRKGITDGYSFFIIDGFSYHSIVHRAIVTAYAAKFFFAFSNYRKLWACTFVSSESTIIACTVSAVNSCNPSFMA